MRAGAPGYLLKGANYKEMLRAIIAVGNDEAIFSPARRPAHGLLREHPTRCPASSLPRTQRARDLDLIAQGHKNFEIAKRLYLSPKTVRNHVSNILSKLQVADRTQAHYSHS